MSLVDYASSDEEDEAIVGREGRNKANPVISHQNEKTHPPAQKLIKLAVQQSSDSCIKHSESSSSTLRLPDASLLLNSPSLPSIMSEKYDHNSRVAAAMAQNASRKRDSTTSFPRGKIPRGNLSVTKSGPETAHDLLRPPQLSGRSNVVTEDINKLFTKRNGAESSTSK